MQGDVIPTGPKTYDFDLYLDYLYDHNYVYKRNDTIPGSGQGYSFDVGLKYLLVKTLMLKFYLEIYWEEYTGRGYRIQRHMRPLTS